MQPEVYIADIPLPVLMLDADGRIRTANVTAQEYMGEPLGTLTGQHVSDLFTPESGMEQLIERVKASGQDISDHRLNLRSKETPCSVHVGRGREGLVVALVPEANRAEIEQHAKRHEMAKAVARIALEMAHEVKNPLAALRGVAQWLSEQEMSEDMREPIRMILAEVDRIHERIDAFLQLAPRANVQMERINIHTLLDDVCRPPTGVQFRRVYDPSLPEILAHPGRLRQAIENLWMNALEAGANQIEWQTRVAAVAHLPDHHGPVMEIRITNDGEAVPVEMRERLFEPFITGKQRGSGLGLALVQRVMLEHDGRVQPVFERGRTSFILHLPIRGGP